MLAYHREWHLRQGLAPLLFHATKLNGEGLAVLSLADLIAHPGTMAANLMRAAPDIEHSFTLHTSKAALQRAAFQSLGTDPLPVR